jgi:hypothetical protein
LTKKYWNNVKAAQMTHLRTVKGCSRADELRNDDKRNELSALPSYVKNLQNIDKWKMHFQTMEQTCIALQAYKYCPVVDEA